jgi:hypothetical protein
MYACSQCGTTERTEGGHLTCEHALGQWIRESQEAAVMKSIDEAMERVQAINDSFSDTYES